MRGKIVSGDSPFFLSDSVTLRNPMMFRPGHYPDLTNAEYHGVAGISKSHLDAVAVSPLHYWQGYVNPNRPPRKGSPTFTLGTAIHGAILEPQHFARDFIVMPDDAPKKPTELQLAPRKGSPKTEHLEAQAWWDEFEAKAQGKTLLTAEQEEIAWGARASVLKHPKAAALLRAGRAEQSYFAIDPDTGALIKARPDWEIEAGGILDVKSTEDASPRGFQHSVEKFRYYVQQPWYFDAIEAATDTPQRGPWYFLAVEKKPPYACALYTLPAAWVREGRRVMRENLQTILDCRALESWPGYCDDAIELELPYLLRHAADDPEEVFAED